jgi:16S rRNA (cytosine967-C5)-methyltransferase
MSDRRRVPADQARLAAYDVITAVSTKDAYANLLLAKSLRDRGLTGKDAALATELVYGTLRNRGSYDAIIGLCADRGLARIDPAVLSALRLGTHQLLGMRVKPHAAVSTTVDLAADVAGRGPAGFVNAVLRRIAPRDFESWIAIAAPDPARDRIGHLAIRYSHPLWIVTAIADALGEDRDGPLPQTEAALAANADRPIVHVAAAPGLASQAELVAAGATAAKWSPYGAYLSHGDPGAIPAVADRRAGVQDEASQLAVLALTRAASQLNGTKAGQRWLDLCAGPGGKARLLAGLAAHAGARLLATDVHHHRAVLTAATLSEIFVASDASGASGAIVTASAAVGGGDGCAGRSAGGAGRAAGRAGRVEVARVVTADGLAPPWRAGTFDLVLADVPCSGLGSLRRRPEARWRRDEHDVDTLGKLQRGLLTTAIEAVRPGGVLGYVTCSPHLAETRSVLADVLAAHEHVEVLDAPSFLPEVPELRCPEPDSRFAQFWPHRHGTDAIFIALLRVGPAS